MKGSGNKDKDFYNCWCAFGVRGLYLDPCPISYYAIMNHLGKDKKNVRNYNMEDARSPFSEIMTDKQTNRPTDGPTDRGLGHEV